MPDAPGLELIAQELNSLREGTVIETAHEHGRATLVVEADGAVPALRWLRDTAGQEYRFLSSLHAADYLPASPRFAVHYELLNRDRIERIRVKALLEDPAAGNGKKAGVPGREAEEMPGDEAGGLPLPTIPSCVELFPTAEFQEREAYDFFGIVFEGHPDLRRILMPEDWEGWPQRRDCPVGGEPVLFTHNEGEVPRWFE